MKTYKPTIGIEVHAELTTKSKMFCGCKNEPHASSPNVHTCPICLAHPGTLPAVNQAAVKKVLMVGAAVSGELATYSEFDRKNYFYPDIPKAYQLSQYAFPFVKGGNLADVALTRIHLEEDTARSAHDQGEGSLVDFNRAGVPLMELVTEPVIHDAKAASHFAKELQLLLRTLGVSNANMEKGEMRVEANISVSPTEELGTKVEVKNLNSFKAVEGAINYEIKRQIELLEAGQPITQETRGWDEAKSKTFSQRTKETAEDYRYFPDPDIPKFDISEINEFDNSRLKEIMPVLPSNKRVLYRDLGLQDEQIEVLIANPEVDTFFSHLLKLAPPSPQVADSYYRLAANYLCTDINALLLLQPELRLPVAEPKQFAELLRMLLANEINSRVAKDLLFEVVFEAASPRRLATERNLLQVSSDDALLEIVAAVIAENESAVGEYKAGKETALKYLVGQGMKLSRGSANPERLSALLQENI